MLTLIHWLFAIYIFIECAICWDRMDHGDKFCRLAKYIMTVVVSFIGLSCCYILPFVVPNKLVVDICLAIWLLPDIALALFLWPTTYARFNGGFKNRIGDA